jgi:hypothetical protein
MKSVWWVLAAVAVASVPVFGSASAGVGVRVNGGVSRISYGDFNAWVDNVNARMATETLAVGAVDKIHWIPEFSGEFLYSFVPGLTVGVGAGMLSGKSTFDVGFADGSYRFEHSVRSYPFTATLYGDLPTIPVGKPYVFGGGAAYYAKITFHETVTAGTEEEWYDADLTAWGFGVHGGAGLEIPIVPMVSADVGVTGRFVRMRRFSGNATGNEGARGEVFLAYYERGGVVGYGPEPVSEKGAYGEGTVDFSGFALTMALHVTW